MMDVHQEADSATGAIDLTQFYQIFFEEAGENLDRFEQILIALNLTEADDEELNAIFRCAHSIKGGAATFGFSDVAELTHHMESLLDRLRRHEIQPQAAMVDVLLESADALRILLGRHQGVDGEPLAIDQLVTRINQWSHIASGQTTSPVQPVAVVPKVLGPSGVRQLKVQVGPLDQPAQADALCELFNDIPGLGVISPLSSDDAAVRLFRVDTSSSDEELLDLFAFHVPKERVTLTLDGQERPSGKEAVKGNDQSLVKVVGASTAQGYGFFAEAPGSPDSASGAVDEASIASPGKKPKTDGKPANASAADSGTIRVAINKVDQLINLVGELVITQAMLAQNSLLLDSGVNQQLLAGLADLDRNTRDLQESVMSIRMIPMSIVFSRFPRMLRDLAGKLGKKVEFVTLGEATELDKGLVEKITDPLTHLVRNSCDHGIEMPEDRLARGKPEHGTITLAASHQGGSILIEVRDDGRGLSREKILRKAMERGMDVSEQMTDAEVWQLIFAPGFSTADAVTDVSGRGVGMDVVKRNIAALNGTVEIDSAEGIGMRVSVRLPLTLAIMDGMSVGVGSEVYILPLSAVVESFQPQNGAISTVGQEAQLVKVRDEYMPVVSLERVFDIPRTCAQAGSNIMVVVEVEGGRVALQVDQLLGQHQVVVKNLEANYRKVPNISGATILGDGRVALILDIASLIRRSRH